MKELSSFINFLYRYIYHKSYQIFKHLEIAKDFLIKLIIYRRGKYSPVFKRTTAFMVWMIAIIVVPKIIQEVVPQYAMASKNVLTIDPREISMYTTISEEVKKYRGGDVVTHSVQEGETIEAIANIYNLEQNTIIWENNFKKDQKLAPQQEVKILPVDGIRHKVSKGETIYTVAKKYGLDESGAQGILDYPFNDFVNDETYELAVGSYIMVPGGRKQEALPAPQGGSYGKITADAGVISANGTYIWPTTGTISQGYSFYHKAIDIANRNAPSILAVDAGTVTTSGWSTQGYGNHVIIDHGNGVVTLYAHMSVINVVAGQTVRQGDVIGKMGSTGRSTGTHLHLEFRINGSFLSPLNYLR